MAACTPASDPTPLPVTSLTSSAAGSPGASRMMQKIRIVMPNSVGTIHSMRRRM